MLPIIWPRRPNIVPLSPRMSIIPIYGTTAADDAAIVAPEDARAAMDGAVVAGSPEIAATHDGFLKATR